AQIDYTTPDFSGFNVTVGVFDPLNSLSEGDAAVEPHKSPGFHAKIAWTIPFSEGNKLYLSAAFLSQQQDYVAPAVFPATTGTPYSYTGDGIDVFGKLDIQGLEVVAYYYHAKGLGSTALFDGGAFTGVVDGVAYYGQTRTSDGYFGQVTYKFGALKLGVNYGQSNLDYASSADQANDVGGNLLKNNKKWTGGLYYSLTKNLTLLAEYSNVKDSAQSAGGNSANTFNVGAFLGF
ncbi:MAG TPA: porin, partial [Steroidobacteraceae bacterium]|nr:porin [Steroidobacteraceae bacterium]